MIGLGSPRIEPLARGDAPLCESLTNPTWNGSAREAYNTEAIEDPT